LSTLNFSQDVSSGPSDPPAPPAPPAPVPVMSPFALLMTMIGLGCAGAWESRRRLQDWFGRHSNRA
jgi:hypothetical protein